MAIEKGDRGSKLVGKGGAPHSSQNQGHKLLGGGYYDCGQKERPGFGTPYRFGGQKNPKSHGGDTVGKK